MVVHYKCLDRCISMYIVLDFFPKNDLLKLNTCLILCPCSICKKTDYCKVQKLYKIILFIDSRLILLYRNFARYRESFFEIIFNILFCNLLCVNENNNTTNMSNCQTHDNVV